MAIVNILDASNHYYDNSISSLTAVNTQDAINEIVLITIDQGARSAISAVDAGGAGSFSYDSGTGIFTYTGPSSAEVRAHFSGGTGVDITNGVVSIGQPVATTDSVTFNDLVVSGNLTVQGTTTTLNTATLNVEDNNITLNAGTGDTSASANGAGITIQDAVDASTDATILWNTTTDQFDISHKLTQAGNTVLDTSDISSSVQSKMTISDTAPSTGVVDADQWWDSNEGILKVRYNGAWVESATSLASIPQGPGSTLDADFLDGLDSTAFVRSNANDTASGIYTFSNTEDSTSIITGTARFAGGIGVAKNIYAGGDVYAYSDQRLKQNIEVIDDAVSKVQALRGVTYERIADGSPSTGVIAQDVNAVLPEAVSTDEEGYMAVKYGNMVGLLIEAIKDQQTQIDELRAEINNLKGDQ